MRIVWCVLVFFVIEQARAQILIGSGGDAFITTTNYVVVSIGEMVIETQLASSNALTFGFNQPILGTISVLEQRPVLVELYPNPTANYARIMTPLSGPLTVELWNTQGQLIEQLVLTPDRPIIDFTYLPTSLYILRFEWNGIPTELKIIKRS